MVVIENELGGGEGGSEGKRERESGRGSNRVFDPGQVHGEIQG